MEQTASPFPGVARGVAGSVPSLFLDVRPAAPSTEVTAALQVRVGMLDESLRTRGITRLVTALASPPTPPGTDAEVRVDLSRTTFVASGPASEVARHLATVAHNLQALPYQDLAPVRARLRAAARGHRPGPADRLCAVRFGAQGPGLVAYPEHGLDWLDSGTVHDWAGRWFTTGNAAVWSTAPVADLEVDLPPGPPRVPSLPDPVLRFLPVGLEAEDGVLCLSAVLGRGVAASALQRHLERRLRERLLVDERLASSVGGSYVPLTAEAAVVTVSADVPAERAARAPAHVLRLLEEMAATGVSPGELARDHRAMASAIRHPDAPRTRLDSATFTLLCGDEPRPDTAWLAELEALTPTAIAAQAGALRRGMIFEARWPGGALPPGFSLPSRHHRELVGTSLRPRAASRRSAERLILAEEGVSRISPTGTRTTVEFSSCVAAFARDGSTRELVDRNGTRIVIAPSRWPDAAVAASHVDARLPAPALRGGPTRRGARPRPVRRRSVVPSGPSGPPRSWVVAGAVLVALAAAAGPVPAMLAALAGGGAAALLAIVRRLALATPPPAVGTGEPPTVSLRLPARPGQAIGSISGVRGDARTLQFFDRAVLFKGHPGAAPGLAQRGHAETYVEEAHVVAARVRATALGTRRRLELRTVAGQTLRCSWARRGNRDREVRPLLTRALGERLDW